MKPQHKALDQLEQFSLDRLYHNHLQNLIYFHFWSTKPLEEVKWGWYKMIEMLGY